jgi:hypothetical protein
MIRGWGRHPGQRIGGQRPSTNPAPHWRVTNFAAANVLAIRDFPCHEAIWGIPSSARTARKSALVSADSRTFEIRPR